MRKYHKRSRKSHRRHTLGRAREQVYVLACKPRSRKYQGKAPPKGWPIKFYDFRGQSWMCKKATRSVLKKIKMEG